LDNDAGSDRKKVTLHPYSEPEPDITVVKKKSARYNGITYEQQTYNFLDEKVTNATVYYCLKQIDFDGKFAKQTERQPSSSL
jgi:hypothetical protein